MPDGCDLLCGNECCECYDKRISLHGVWPIGRIGEVKAAEVYKGDEEAQEAFQRRMDAGIEWACIPTPNPDKIRTEGMRVQLYCMGCREIQGQDMLSKPYGRGRKLVDAAEAEVRSPSPCPKCGGERASCETERVPCPKCGMDMTRIGWFTKGF